MKDKKYNLSSLLLASAISAMFGALAMFTIALIDYDWHFMQG